ncbi:MAG: cupin domain-containing protein [Hamadaea sp.]|nr:cupin domain-containing protein [Hamadaea sp.]
MTKLVNPFAVELTPDGPGVRSAVLHSDGAVERGIWEIDPGVVEDVEADELFVVHSGHATVTFLGRAEEWDLVPGFVGLFTAGEQTRWTVHSRLRKTYQITR